MADWRSPFTQAEFDRRLALVRSRMDRAGVDVLVIADPSNMAWLTGYDGWSFYVPQAAVVERSGPPLWWGRRQDVAGAIRTVWMEPGRCVGYPDILVQNPPRHPVEDLGRRLADMGHGSARIGVEADNYYWSARAQAVLADRLPSARLVDATGLVNRCRTVKSAEELGLMRKAARISERLVGLAIDLAEPGLPKNRLIAQVMAAGIEGTEDQWGDYPAIVPLAPSGPDAAAPHLTWNGEPLRAGEATFFELSGCVRRYHAPLCRTVHLGPAPDHMKRAADALVAGLEAGLAAALPGNRARDVANALAAELEKAGIRRADRCGYPVGLSYPPDWGERTISFRAEDDTPLEAGMTFHFMPGLWMDDWGLEITETILVREDGPAEPLAQFPRKLFER